MQTRNDGTHVILPAAALIARRPDRAGLPVTMLRHSDGKVRHDGSSAAFMQPVDPVGERGRLHGASELDARIRNRGIAHRIVYYRRFGEERRWRISIQKHNRLRRLDKSAHIARWPVARFFRVPRRDAHIAPVGPNVRRTFKALYPHRLFHIAGQRHGW